MDHHKEHQMEHMAQYSSEDIDGKLVIGLRDISHTMRSLYEGRGSQKRILIVLSETGTISPAPPARALPSWKTWGWWSAHSVKRTAGPRISP